MHDSQESLNKISNKSTSLDSKVKIINKKGNYQNIIKTPRQIKYIPNKNNTLSNLKNQINLDLK